jgi:hypothetical protein
MHRFVIKRVLCNAASLMHSTIQESAAAAALSSGAEGPQHLRDAEARLKTLDRELQEERQ